MAAKPALTRQLTARESQRFVNRLRNALGLLVEFFNFLIPNRLICLELFLQLSHSRLPHQILCAGAGWRITNRAGGGTFCWEELFSCKALTGFAIPASCAFTSASSHALS